MTIIEDTRQQAKQHVAKQEQMIRLGAKIIRSKLPIGDYALLTDLSTVIDTKKDMTEVYLNIITDHKRFVKELKKAKENGIKLIVLVEHGKGITNIDDVKKWVNPQIARYKSEIRKALIECDVISKFDSISLDEMIRLAKENRVAIKKSPVSSEQLAKAMLTLTERYGVEFQFCNKCDTGKRIVEIFGGDSIDKG